MILQARSVQTHYDAANDRHVMTGFANFSEWQNVPAIIKIEEPEETDDPDTLDAMLEREGMAYKNDQITQK